MGKLAIETRGLKKSFGKTHAVAGGSTCSDGDDHASRNGEKQ